MPPIQYSPLKLIATKASSKIDPTTPRVRRVVEAVHAESPSQRRWPPNPERPVLSRVIRPWLKNSISNLSLIFQPNEQTLQGSFSSVSTPNLASKYSLELANIRWKALDEIYKIYMLLHRSDLNISENFRQFFSHFSNFLAKICKNSLFLNSFHWFLLRFWWNFIGISPII